MFFLDSSFLCGDVMSIPCTPTGIANINHIEIGSAEFDDLYVTKNTAAQLTENCPKEWDFKTILYAKFDDNTLASNVDWSLKSVSHLLIKRRKANAFKWMTLLVKQVENIEDFDISFRDITGADSTDYQYAVVPLLNGMEGSYSTADVHCKTQNLVIADEDEIWSTMITDGFCDAVSNVPSSAVITMYDKYPTIIRNTSANYETVNITASFIPTDEENSCDLLYDDNAVRTSYSKRFKEFLTNGKTKLLKNIDGRIWLGYITTPPTDSAGEVYYNRTLTFGLTETGDAESEEDLYEAGLITAAKEWWNQ